MIQSNQSKIWVKMNSKWSATWRETRRALFQTLSKSRYLSWSPSSTSSSFIKPIWLSCRQFHRRLYIREHLTPLLSGNHFSMCYRVMFLWQGLKINLSMPLLRTKIEMHGSNIWKRVILDKLWSTVRVTKSRMFQEFMLIRNLLLKSIKKLPNSTLKVPRLSRRSL